MCWGCRVSSLYKIIGIEKNVEVIKLNENTELENKYILPSKDCFTSMSVENFFLGKPYNEKFVKQFIFKIIKLVNIEKTEFYHEMGQIIYHLKAINSEGEEVDVQIIKKAFQKNLDSFGDPQEIKVEATEESKDVFMFVTLRGRPLSSEETDERNMGYTAETIMYQRGFRTYMIKVDVCEERTEVKNSPFFEF